MEQYSKQANDPKRGMTLLELELFVMTAKKAGIAPGACLTGVVTLKGRQKSIMATNEHSPKRHQFTS